MSYNLFDKYGIDKCDIILLELVEANSKDELHTREAHYIKTICCINKCIPMRTKPEYRQDNKARISERGKKYNEDNREKIREQKRIYHRDNKERLGEQIRIFRDKNKEKVFEREKLYREKHNEKN